MNTVTPKKKDAILKSLAIIGFLGLIVIIAWLSIQVVRLAPSAFSSLASIAEGINSYQSALGENDEDLVISSEQEQVESGTPAIITWEKDKQAGTYAFSYDCLDGISVEVLDTEGLRAIACDTNYVLGNTDNITIITESKNTEVSTLTYSVTFTHENDPEQTRSGSAALAVNSVSDTSEQPTEPDVVLDGNDQSDFEAEVVVEPAPTPATPITPRSTPPAPTPTYTYTMPVSDPNGYVDLGTLFRSTGTIKNGAFVAGAIKQDADGAFQFEVKNYGTKTSESWTYTVTLPDGDTYTSPTQPALKPTERVFIAIGFPVENDSSHTFTVQLKTISDKNKANDSFKKAVTFVK